MSDKEYFGIKRLSNSDLQNAVYIIAGMPIPEKSTGVFAVGREIHGMILEGKTHKQEHNDYTEKEIDVIIKAVAAAEKSERIQYITEIGELEKVVLWEFEGIHMKSKLDIHIPNERHVFDLKTTSCSTEIKFIEDVKKYRYVRQLALYAKSVEAENATIIGISKINGKIFEICLSKEELEEGLEEARKICKKIKELNILEKVFLAR